MARQPSVALVHDYLLVMRGAERTFAEIAACWPEAPIYTLLYNPQAVLRRFDHREVHTSSLQHSRAGQRGFRRLLPLFGRAARGLPTDRYDVVISSSSAFAHRVRTGPAAVHVCYCHSPFRYAWHERSRALEEMPSLLRPALRALLWRIRQGDVRAARGVTHLIANSRTTRRRIQEFWGRDASIVHPPVAVERFSIGVPEDWFLVVAELVRHKRVDLALEACRRAGRPAKVVGVGPELERLRAAYGAHAEFVGRPSDTDLADLYSRARALVVAGPEEFGIAAVESQAAGRPVVVVGTPVTCDTVIEGKTGVLVPPGDVDALAEAIRYTDFDRFDPRGMRMHAESFSSTVFRRRFANEVQGLTGVQVPAPALSTVQGGSRQAPSPSSSRSLRSAR